MLLALLLLAAPDQIAIVAQTIPRGGAVDRSNIELVESKSRKLPRMVSPYVWQDGERLRARHTLRAGAVLGQWDVEPMPAIAAGDTVLVELIRNNVRVTAEAMAKEDGFVGATIWIENRKSQRRLRAKVIEPGRVRIESLWRQP